jgi:small subunit ribosomal protein S6
VAEIHREYECCALYRPDLEAEALDALIQGSSDLIVNRGGEVVRVDRWNKRFLAYPIKNYTEGFYVIYRFIANPQVLPDLNYQLRFSDDCLRYLVLDYTEKERKRRKRLAGRKARAEVQQ